MRERWTARCVNEHPIERRQSNPQPNRSLPVGFQALRNGERNAENGDCAADDMPAREIAPLGVAFEADNQLRRKLPIITRVGPYCGSIDSEPL